MWDTHLTPNNLPSYISATGLIFQYFKESTITLFANSKSGYMETVNVPVGAMLGELVITGVSSISPSLLASSLIALSVDMQTIMFTSFSKKGMSEKKYVLLSIAGIDMRRI